MNSYFKNIFFLLLLLVLSSCATVFKGNNSNVFFESEPSGTDVKIDNKIVGQTPCKIDVDGSENHKIEFVKKGYLTNYDNISKSFGYEWLAINFLNYGLLSPIPDLIDIFDKNIYQCDKIYIKAKLISTDSAPNRSESMQNQYKPERYAKDNFFLEGGTTIQFFSSHDFISYSLNYERILLENLGLRIGFGRCSDDYNNSNSALLIPMGINYLFGQSQHKIEISGGVNYFKFYINPVNAIPDTSFTHSEYGYYGSIGYRYQPLTSGLIFRFNSGFGEYISYYSYYDSYYKKGLITQFYKSTYFTFKLSVGYAF